MILYPVAQLSRRTKRLHSVPQRAATQTAQRPTGLSGPPGGAPRAPRPPAGSRQPSAVSPEPLPIFRQLLELVRSQVRIHPAGRNLRNPIGPHLDLVSPARQLDHDSMEDVVLLVAQEALRPADLLAGLIHHRRLLRHSQPGDLA